MRAATLLTAMAVLMAQPAMSDIVRRNSIPEPLWGKWVPDTDDCSGKMGLVIAANKYVDAGNECTIRTISETAGRTGAFYSTRSVPCERKNVDYHAEGCRPHHGRLRLQQPENTSEMRKVSIGLTSDCWGDTGDGPRNGGEAS